MEKILRDIAKILDFNDSFFCEVESLGKFGFFETDLKSGKYKASKNFKNLFHLPEKKFYKTAEFLEKIHPDDIVRVKEDMEACRKERKNVEVDYRVILDGAVFFIREKSVFILNKSGEPVKLVGMKQNVTEEKIAETERREYIKKLEQAHERTSTIVHDLKAPVQNISMIAELLKENEPEGKDEMIEMLEISCRRSLEIIEDVLEKSFVEGDSCRIERKYCSINKIIDKAVKTFFYTSQKKGIRILTRFRSEMFAFVYPQKLQRAIENLLSNAVKFSHRGSKIEVSLYGEGNVIFIKIEDFGLGMNETQKRLLFQKGSPMRDSVRKNGTGGEKSFGRGMDIVKKIANMHKGKIKVISEESKGTAFCLELPKE